MRTPLLILLTVIAAICTSTVAQRRVTPVTPPPAAVRHQPASKNSDDPEEKPLPPSVVHYHDPSGKVLLIDTISGTEYVDSTAIEAAKPKGRIYPLMHAVTVGVNVWDPLMRCFGQHHGLFDVWAELSLHNWIKPVFEFGLGAADNTPDDGNFTYHSPTAPYFKIGANYNFLYNSNPAYQFMLGLRYGFTSFNYEIKDVTTSPGYWDEPSSFNVPRQTSTVGYGEFLLGLRVQIYRNISMGWFLKYHWIFHESAAAYGQPWYIPGYGSRGSAITGAFSISYTLPLNKPAPTAVDTQIK